MIQYKFPEEKNFIIHYARVLNRPKVEKIIEAGCVKSSEEASQLASFFLGDG